jgi:hypothetical protein
VWPLLEQDPTAQDLIRNRHKKESQRERVEERESFRERDQCAAVERLRCVKNRDLGPAVMFITAVPNTKLCAWGEEDSGGNVL